MPSFLGSPNLVDMNLKLQLTSRAWESSKLDAFKLS